MNVEQMRDYISNAYPGDKWKARCACMRSNQVIAIFHSLQSRDRDRQKANEVASGIKEKI